MNTLLYDMLVGISQREINSQFERMFKSGYIKNEISANCLAKSGGSFGKGSLVLSSYLRGAITAPKVSFGGGPDPKEVIFSFCFQSKPASPADFGVTDADFKSAFAQNQDGASAPDGLLQMPEDIPTNGQPVKAQKVYYWLKRQTTKIGTMTNYSYNCIPSLFFKDGDGNLTMVDLSGLELSFKVLLSQIPTSADEIQLKVQSNKAPKELLETINGKGFNSSAFSLNQLFLDFDTVDFAQWTLKDPLNGLGKNITGISVQNDGSFAAATVAIADLLNGDDSFSQNFSGALHNAFGFGQEDSFNKKDYMIGVIATSNTPAASGQNEQASIVPTYIGFSTSHPLTPNHPGRASLNYQVMCGNDWKQRLPKNQNGTVADINTNYITNDNFSGEALFAADTFFVPFVLLKLQAAMRSGADWTNNGEGYWTSHFKGSQKIREERPVTASTGHHRWVTQTDDNTYNIKIAGNIINVWGTLNRTITIDYRLVVANNDQDPVYEWWNSGVVNWNNDIGLFIGTNGELNFTANPNFPDPVVGTPQKNSAANSWDEFIKLFGFTDENDSLAKNETSESLKKMEKSLSQNLMSGTKSNFISPTGKTFFLNNPRLANDGTLQMDITYEV